MRSMQNKKKLYMMLLMHLCDEMQRKRIIILSICQLTKGPLNETMLLRAR